MTGAEYFAALSDAVRKHDAAMRIVTDGEPRRGEGGGVHTSSISDPTARAAESAMRAQQVVDAMQEIIGEGLRVIEAIRVTLGDEYGDALDARYIDLLSWRDVAARLGCTHPTAMARAGAAIDWYDHKGRAWLLDQVADTTN